MEIGTMIRDQIQEDHRQIWQPEHASAVAERLTEGTREMLPLYAKFCAIGPLRYKTHRMLGPTMPAGERLALRWKEAIADFRSQQERKYDPVIHPEALEEFADDPATFVRVFCKDLPILNKARNAAIREMESWKRRLHQHCRQNPREFLAFVTDLVGYVQSSPSFDIVASMAAQGEPLSMPLDQMDMPLEEVLAESRTSGTTNRRKATSQATATTTLRIPGVLGVGISSGIGYYRRPDVFPWRNRLALAACYFLADRDPVGLETSEFIYWDTATNRCWTNYTYPFRLFVFHAVRILAEIEAFAVEHGAAIHPDYRMVVLGDFLSFVAADNQKEIDAWAEEPNE
jgi:hypothetical protein